jgi:transcriptional regulator with XRE-family HTH domain
MVNPIVLAEVRYSATSGQARVIREGAGLSLAEVAAYVHVNPATVSLWERGLAKPTGRPAVDWYELLCELCNPRSPLRRYRDPAHGPGGDG